MPFRVTYFHQVQQKLLGGWSENFWHGATDLIPASTAALALRDLLDAVHGNEVVNQSVRISDATTFRDVTQLAGAAPTSATSTPATETDYVTTAALLKLTSLDRFVTRQWIRGVRDAAVRGNAKWDPQGAYLTAWKSFLAALSTSSFGWTMRVVQRIPLAQRKQIKAFSPAGVLTVTAHGFTDLDLVRVSRVKGDPRSNRVWRINRIDTDTFSLIGWVELAAPFPYLGGGTAVAQVYSFKPVAQAEVVRATSHRTGRPSGLLGGRRRRRQTLLVGTAAVV